MHPGAARVLQLQRTAGNHAVTGVLAGGRRLQRVIGVDNRNADADYQTAATAVLGAAPFATWAQTIHALQDVTLLIVVEPDPDPLAAAVGRQNEGSTVLSAIAGVALTGGQSVEWWRQNLVGRDVTFRITIKPQAGYGPGDVKAVLMHELMLHAQPMLASLQSLRAHHAGPATTNPQRQRLLAHVTNILDGEDPQHSDFQGWNAYLDRALVLGAADKQAGQIEIGSDLIQSAVNDVMTHASTPALMPLLTQQQRTQLYTRADQIGVAEDLYRDQHPEVWPVSPPSSPALSGHP
jgi:hypothetical protein